jgi:hypothetical protein
VEFEQGLETTSHTEMVGALYDFLLGGSMAWYRTSCDTTSGCNDAGCFGGN